jgi:hypothetical protein
MRASETIGSVAAASAGGYQIGVIAMVDFRWCLVVLVIAAALVVVQQRDLAPCRQGKTYSETIRLVLNTSPVCF